MAQFGLVDYDAMEITVNQTLDDVFVQNVTALRESRGWSIHELARQMPACRGWVSRVLSGENNPSLRSIQRFADVFEVQAYTLIMPHNIVEWKAK